MKFIHAGLAVSSEEKADRFYADILGLEKSSPKVLEKRLSHILFGIEKELLIINYTSGDVGYEILIYPEYKSPEKQIAHSCISVNGLKDIVDKCKKEGLKIIEASKGSRTVTFISDYDGNLFELKA